MSDPTVPESWFRIRKSTRAMAGSILIIIASGLFFHGLYDGGLQLYLRAAGEPVTGVIVAVFRGRAAERTRLGVSYVDPDGGSRYATVATASSAWQRGQTVDLLVVRAVPELAMLENTVRSGRSLVETLLLGGIGAGLLPLGVWLYAGFRRRARLALGRTPFRETEGECLGCVERPYKLGDYTPLAVRYAFFGLDGARHEARSPDLPRGWPPPSSGPIKVRYTRRDPRLSLPILTGPGKSRDRR